MPPSDTRITLTESEARRAHRVLQAVWIIVSARHDDAVARDVAALGDKLRTAIEANDWRAAGSHVAEVRGWLATMAGVVGSRLQHLFEQPNDPR